MKITLPASILSLLLEEGDFGEIVDELINELYLNLSPEEVDRVSKSAQKSGRSYEEALHAYCSSLLEKESQTLLSKARKEERLLLRPLSPSDYQQNPYYDLFSGLKGKKEAHLGPFTLGFELQPALVPFSLQEKTLRNEDPLEDQAHLGYFPTDFSFPCLKEKGRIWMSLVPHEIETMKEPLKKMRGNVLTLGCGLGYFAFMAAEKKDVTAVTVVEKDSRVLSLFSTFLLPFFPSKSKIRLVEADAFEFLNSTQESFDASFCDLWHDVEDGLPLYLRLLPQEKKMGEATYWIEKDLLVYLRRHVLALMEEETAGAQEENYQQADNFSDSLINALHVLLKQTPVESKKELQSLLSDASLKSLARGLNLAQ